MRLRTISLLSLLPLCLWLCLFQPALLPGQEAASVPTPPAPIPAADAPLQTQSQAPAQAPVHALPGPTMSSSVSSNKQFVVHGGDLSVRSTFCLMSEETAGTLGRLLKDDGRYAIPVVVEVKTAPNVNPAEPTVKPRISLMDFGGFHLQLSVQLRNDFRTEDYNRELVRILLAERILRNHKDINTERERDILPEWLLTGVMQAMEFRSRSRPSVLFAAVFKSGQVYSIDRILAADPKNLDAFARGVYEVSSCALVLTLMDQPDGPVRVSRFLGALATDDRPGRELLQQHFPTLGASKNSLEKWWTLQMASLSTPSAFETMTIKETEEMLDKALTLHFTDRIGEEPADIKAGREGKGIFGWLKRDDKGKEKEKEQNRAQEVVAKVSTEPQMPVSSSASSALPIEGASASDVPPPLGKPAPDMPPLPSSLPPPPAPDNNNAPGPAPQDAPPPASETTPSPTSAASPQADAPKEKEAAKPDKETKPKEEPAPEKPKPRRTAPKPAAKPTESKPASTAPATTDKATPAPAPQQGNDKATEKPADPAKPEEAAPEEKKERKRFRFPNLFGGKDVTYTLMLLAMAAVAENAANANTKEKENQKPAAKEEQKTKPEEAVPSLPRNNRRVGARPAGLPETQPSTKPAAAPAPAPKPEEAPKTKPETPAAKPNETAPAPAEEGEPENKKVNRFNPFGWLKRGEKEKKAEEAPPANTPGTGEAAKPEATPARVNAARPATELPEKAVGQPSEPSRTASRSSSSSATSKLKPGLAALEDYRRIWKRSDREDILNRNLAMLNALTIRAHPLYKPLVEDYATVVQQLSNGKERGVAEKLETLRQRRMQIQGKAKAVESFLDWYEASETQTYSNLFDDYLKLRDRLERERTQRADALSRDLDALEKEYE